MKENRTVNELVHLINKNIDQGHVMGSDMSLFPMSCKIPIDLEEFRLKKFFYLYEKFIIKKIKN